MTQNNRPRLVDLANRLGVAPSTVSRALADSESISAETKARVQAAAAEMGYAVNPAASGLKRGSTLNIGLVAAMNHWYSGAVATGADRVAAERGYDFVVANAAGGEAGQLQLDRARRLGSRVDGALVVDISPQSGALADLIASLAVPVVAVGSEHPDVSSVLVDNVAIGRTAAEHLVDHAHRDAVVLALHAPNTAAIDNSVIRAEGFGQVLADAPTVRLSRTDRADRQAAILAATSGATAVFCTTDDLAIEVVALMRQAGRAVPDDISVVGVDDHPLAQPIGLTTIAQDPDCMGELATELLLETIAMEPARRLVVATELVVRQTTGPAPR